MIGISPFVLTAMFLAGLVFLLFIIREVTRSRVEGLMLYFGLAGTVSLGTAFIVAVFNACYYEWEESHSYELCVMHIVGAMIYSLLSAGLLTNIGDRFDPMKQARKPKVKPKPKVVKVEPVVERKPSLTSGDYSEGGSTAEYLRMKKRADIRDFSTGIEFVHSPFDPLGRMKVKQYRADFKCGKMGNPDSHEAIHSSVYNMLTHILKDESDGDISLVVKYRYLNHNTTTVEITASHSKCKEKVVIS